MGGIGFSEILIVLLLALVLFGPSRLPQLGEGLGKAIRGFREAMKDGPADPKQQ